MMTFHEVQMEINRQDAKLQRAKRTVEQTEKVIASLKSIQEKGEGKK